MCKHVTFLNMRFFFIIYSYNNFSLLSMYLSYMIIVFRANYITTLVFNSKCTIAPIFLNFADLHPFLNQSFPLPLFHERNLTVLSEG